MAVSPNTICGSFCTWVLATEWLEATNPQKALIAIVQTAANTSGTVTDNQWNDFLRTTGLWYQYYTAYLAQTTNTASLPANIVQGDLIYGSAANTLSRLAKSATTNSFLKNSGTSNNPAWSTASIAILTDYSAYVDYSATSTIAGMNTFTLKTIYYSVYANVVFVEWALFGKMTSTSFSFTLPFASAIGGEVCLVRIDTGAGTFATNPGGFSLTASTVTISKDLSSAALTNGNTVRAYGNFWYFK